MHFQIGSMGSVARSIECDRSPYSLEGHSLVIYTTRVEVWLVHVGANSNPISKEQFCKHLTFLVRVQCRG